MQFIYLIFAIFVGKFIYNFNKEYSISTVVSSDNIILNDIILNGNFNASYIERDSNLRTTMNAEHWETIFVERQHKYYGDIKYDLYCNIKYENCKNFFNNTIQTYNNSLGVMVFRGKFPEYDYNFYFEKATQNFEQPQNIRNATFKMQLLIDGDKNSVLKHLNKIYVNIFKGTNYTTIYNYLRDSLIYSGKAENNTEVNNIILQQFYKKYGEFVYDNFSFYDDKIELLYRGTTRRGQEFMISVGDISLIEKKDNSPKPNTNIAAVFLILILILIFMAFCALCLIGRRS